MESVIFVRSVWEENFDAESAILCQLAPRVRHVALNVQYPGCVVRANGGAGAIPMHQQLTVQQRYDIIRANVNLLKPLQIGIAISTYDGQRYAWEYNLCGYEITNPEEKGDISSIAYLVQRGLDFNRLSWSGIHWYRLRWMLHDSGLFRAGPSWTTFAGAYHVAYFMRVMYGELPVDVEVFEKKVRVLLRSVYDVKMLAKEEGGHVGSLENVAQQLGVVVPPNGLGASKLAGAGSMMALLSFEALKVQTSAGNVERHRNALCGLHAA